MVAVGKSGVWSLCKEVDKFWNVSWNWVVPISRILDFLVNCFTLIMNATKAERKIMGRSRFVKFTRERLAPALVPCFSFSRNLVFYQNGKQ